MDDTKLILAAAIAVGVGIWAFEKPLTDITGPIGHTITEITDAPHNIINDIEEWWSKTWT